MSPRNAAAVTFPAEADATLQSVCARGHPAFDRDATTRTPA
jgi:hypothetical protein